MKISFIIILGILGILVAIFFINGCSYPTSYRAFIPKSLDSEYKEFERLCKEEIGKVVYARPVPKGTKLEDMLRLKTEMRIGDSIALIIGGVKIKHKEYYYFYVEGFKYYTNWTEKSFSMHDDSRKFIKCEPLILGKDWKEELTIMKKIAFNNKEYIGENEILQEHSRIYYKTYMSQIFKEAIYAKSSHYIGNKDIK